MLIDELPTPAVVVDAAALERNLATMAAALPGDRLRPHVKAHKCTALAARQAAHGHRRFTCATPREVLGLAAAGLGDDLLLANEVVDHDRLAAMAACGARVTVAVDSPATVGAAAAAGIAEVVVDVDVGLPRCGCPPDAAGRIAEEARRAGLEVRGVMGYEGHLMMVTDRSEQRARVEAAMTVLRQAHEAVGGELVSAGGTGTYDLNEWATEIQAGTYALMDSDYQRLGLPFEPAVRIVATVIAVRDDWAVCDAGLKAFGLDHGNPVLDGGKVWFCSDEHTTFAPERRLRVGERVTLVPAHLDPTLARHERLHLCEGPEVVETVPIDLRHW